MSAKYRQTQGVPIRIDPAIEELCILFDQSVSKLSGMLQRLNHFSGDTFVGPPCKDVGLKETIDL